MQTSSAMVTATAASTTRKSADGMEATASKATRCQVTNPKKVGDGSCDGGEYNIEECGWDGGDCVEGYPDCQVTNPKKVGDGSCDGGQYNIEECGWDGGDCLEFNSRYPDCHVEHHYRIGDGYCDGGQYNTAECGYDGGDCEEFNRQYPNCNVDIPDWIDDGFCNFGSGYNAAKCGYDGGDCLFERFLNTKCKGSVISISNNKNRAWCQKKCLDEGSSCKAYDISVYREFQTGTCRIFSSFSSTRDYSDSKCYKKKQ